MVHIPTKKPVYLPAKNQALSKKVRNEVDYLGRVFPDLWDILIKRGQQLSDEEFNKSDVLSKTLLLRRELTQNVLSSFGRLSDAETAEYISLLRAKAPTIFSFLEFNPLFLSKMHQLKNKKLL